MKKITTVAVIAALTLATQAFAMGGSSKAGQTMPSTMSTTTMNSGSKMTTGTHSMAATAPMSGTGTMTTTMSATGTTKAKMKPGSTTEPVVAK